MKKQILIIAAHRADRSPSQRFRFEQYLNYLTQNGYQVVFSNLISAWDDKYFYRKGGLAIKFFIFLKFILKRIRDSIRANQFDIIFIQREAFSTGTIFFEKWMSKSKAKIVFDFDDSIWLANVSAGNKMFGWLKNADKTKDIIALSDLIFAGNKYLYDYSLQFNKNAVIVPTTIDTDEYIRKEIKKDDDKICIGWSGSFTTIQHFEFAVPFLKEIKKIFDDRVYIKVIGDKNYVNAELNIQGADWKKETEIEDLSEFDIGIMPLPDDEWAKGKCGLKGLQYMALEIPTIMSPVGVNVEIIESGENGFLASTEQEWIEKISLLINSKELRIKTGKAGRETVLKNYSVTALKPKYLELLNSLIKK